MDRAAKQIPLFPETPDTESGLSVRVSHRAKRLSIKVYPRGKVEVVVPKRARPGDVEKFVEESRDWIAKTKAAFADHVPHEPFRLPVRVTLPGIDDQVGIHYEPASGENVRYRRTGDIVRLRGPVNDDQACVSALKRWLSATAREHFEPKLRALSAATGNNFERMHVRGQKTCWGSHSSSGTISLNYCLLFLKPALVRYLMIHELCHAAHMNHSKRFWALVEKHEPDYRRLDRQLSDAWREIPAWLGIY